MKIILFFALCMRGALIMAQDTSESRLIKVDFKGGSTHNEQALLMLSATNKLETGSQVEYKAGKSITLLPGFEAETGTQFVAHIGKVSIIATIEGQSQPLIITAYPNPFDDKTIISYTLTKSAKVTLYISDVKGAVLNRLVDNAVQEAGHHEVEWKGNLLAAGTYICLLSADQEQISNRIVKK